MHFYIFTEEAGFIKLFPQAIFVVSDLHVEASGWDGGPRIKGYESPNSNSNTRVYKQHHGSPANLSRSLRVVGIDHTNADDWICPESEGVPSEVLTGMRHVHPYRKNKENTHRNSHDRDYYSLGMVLTELGLRKQLDHLEPESAFLGESTAAPDRWLREYVPQLSPSMGGTYQSIVAWCLEAANKKPTFDEVDEFKENVVNEMKDRLL